MQPLLDWILQATNWVNVFLTIVAVTGIVATVWTWIRLRLRGLREIEVIGEQLIAQMEAKGYRPDLVVGIGRGGAFTGGWLAGNLGTFPIEVVERMHQDDSTTPMTFLNGEKKFAYLREAWPGPVKALIVEGASARGTTLREFKKLQQTYLPDWQCTFCVFYDNKSSNFPIDFYGVRDDKLRDRYPWHKTDKYRHYLYKSV